MGCSNPTELCIGDQTQPNTTLLAEGDYQNKDVTTILCSRSLQTHWRSEIRTQFQNWKTILPFIFLKKGYTTHILTSQRMRLWGKTTRLSMTRHSARDSENSDFVKKVEEYFHSLIFIFFLCVQKTDISLCLKSIWSTLDKYKIQILRGNKTSHHSWMFLKLQGHLIIDRILVPTKHSIAKC